MIEMRWVRRDLGTMLQNRMPPGAVPLGDRFYMKLQYRYRQPTLATAIDALPQRDWGWVEWQDVAPPEVTL